MAPISQIAIGSHLVLATWAVSLVITTLAGLPMATWIQGRKRLDIDLQTIRRSVWWGVVVVLSLVLAASLSAPLASARALIIVAVPVGALAVIGSILCFRGRCDFGNSVSFRLTHVWVALGTFLFIASFFAVAALGPANNYDTGLYHLGSIKYSADFGVVPGLANLYFPFGYANSHFAFAGWLSSTPWGLEGYRLINGLVIMLVLVDLLLRWMEKKRTPGTWVVTIGLTAAAFPLISIADFWVTSPTSDSAVMVLTIAASAYLIDALVKRNLSDAAMSIVIVLLMVAMRPTMLVFGLVVALVSVGALVLTRSKEPLRGSVLRAGLAVGTVAAVLGGLQVFRDRLLSGWLVYPLSVLPFDVPWRSPDPTPFRDATLAAARNPAAADQYQVAHSWDWIGPWFADRWQMWETYMLLGLLALGGLAWWLVKPVDGRFRWQVLGVLWLPSGLASLAWFIASPPSYRFAWGPLLVFASAPLVAVLIDRHRSEGFALDAGKWIARVCGGLVVGLVLVSLTLRIDYASISETRTWTLAGLTLSYAVTPQPMVPTTSVVTDGGVEVQIPDVGDQCWDNYPLCTPLPTQTLRYAGGDLSEGFES